MSDKPVIDYFDEMDRLWENFKSATWNKMSVPSGTIQPEPVKIEKR